MRIKQKTMVNTKRTKAMKTMKTEAKADDGICGDQRKGHMGLLAPHMSWLERYTKG